MIPKMTAEQRKALGPVDDVIRGGGDHPFEVYKNGEWIKMNEHKINGYKELTDYEIGLINHFKNLEKNLLTEIRYQLSKADPRWVDIGKTHIEQGFMAFVRAIAKPE